MCVYLYPNPPSPHTQSQARTQTRTRCLYHASLLNNLSRHTGCNQAGSTVILCASGGFVTTSPSTANSLVVDLRGGGTHITPPAARRHHVVQEVVITSTSTISRQSALRAEQVINQLFSEVSLIQLCSPHTCSACYNYHGSHLKKKNKGKKFSKSVSREYQYVEMVECTVRNTFEAFVVLLQFSSFHS